MALRPTTSAILLAGSALFLWTACPVSLAPNDVAGSDAGREAGTPDAGNPEGPGDAGPADDAGAPEDAGLIDAGAWDAGANDAGLPDDAGTEEDAGHARDGGRDRDAGHENDAGSDTDAGRACTTNAQCMSTVIGAAEYCNGTTCTDEGTCVDRPTSCQPSGPGPQQPVCGCDGTTYASQCEAARAGVRVSSDGPCNALPDGGEEDAGTGDAGQCQTYSPLPCGAVEACHCNDGSTQLAGCAGPPTCADACCAYGGAQ